MTARTARWLPVAGGMLAVSAVATVLAAALIWATQGFPALPTSFARGPINIAIGMAAALSYVGAGWLLVSRVPGNAIGWLLLAIGIVYASMAPTALLVDAASGAYRAAPPLTLMVAWVVSSFSAPVIGVMAIAIGLLFPDGRVPRPYGRLAVILASIGAVLICIAGAADPAGLVWYPTLPNPYAAPSSFAGALDAAEIAGGMALVAGGAVAVMAMARRYRSGDATVRAQMRWILFAGAILAVAMAPFILVRFILNVGEALGELVLTFVNAATAILPIAAAFAITRYHLFGINLIIGRTLVYVPLMAILGGMYTASIAIFQRIFVAVTGESSDVPLVITIFLVAAAFTPVRKGLEGAVDRWVRGAGTTAMPAAAEHPDPAVTRAASELVALRRLEERFAAESRRATGQPTVERRLPIDGESRVHCPAGGRPHFVACLGCRYLDAVLTTPPTVVCSRPALPAGD